MNEPSSKSQISAAPKKPAGLKNLNEMDILELIDEYHAAIDLVAETKSMIGSFVITHPREALDMGLLRINYAGTRKHRR